MSWDNRAPKKDMKDECKKKKEPGTVVGQI